MCLVFTTRAKYPLCWSKAVAGVETCAFPRMLVRRMSGWAVSKSDGGSCARVRLEVIIYEGGDNAVNILDVESSLSCRSSPSRIPDPC